MRRISAKSRKFNHPKIVNTSFLDKTKPMQRCFGKSPTYAAYHDNEWGVPVYDDKILFEFIILEGAQAGLSWETILNKRDGYKKAFKNFDATRVANMSDKELEALREEPSIVRNRLKIYSARTNAKAFLEIQKEYKSFSDYLWGYVDGKQIINHWKELAQVPVTTSLSDKISKDLKARGMKFVGSTIIYSYLQAVGVVDDHVQSCWKRTGAQVT